jgi:hypothetical protein
LLHPKLQPYQRECGVAFKQEKEERKENIRK